MMPTKIKQAGPKWDAFRRGLSWDTIKGPLAAGAKEVAPTAGERLSNLTGKAVTGTGMSIGLTAGTHGVLKGIGDAYHAIKDKFDKPAEYKAMLDAHPELQEISKQDAGKVQMAFNSLRHLAPSLASDPLVAGSFVRQVLAQSPEQGLAIPTQTANMLADTQRKITGPKGPESPYGKMNGMGFYGEHSGEFAGSDPEAPSYFGKFDQL